MIRKANAKDLVSIISLFRLNSTVYSECEIIIAKKYIQEIIESHNYKNDSYFVFVDSGRVIGCAGYALRKDTENVFSLNWLAVHPRFKRKGIATKLYQYIEEQIKLLNARLIILNAGSYEENKFFYEKMGFIIVGTIPKYYSDTKDLIQYCKLL